MYPNPISPCICSKPTSPHHLSIAQAGCCADGGVPQERGRSPQICNLPGFSGVFRRLGKRASQVQHKDGGGLQKDAAAASRLPIQSVTRSSSQSSKRSEFGLTKQRLEFGKGVNPTSNGFTKMKSHRLFVCCFKRCTPSAKKVGNANNDICFPSLGSVCLCHQSCHFPTLGSQPCLPVSGQSFVGRPEAKEREG